MSAAVFLFKSYVYSLRPSAFSKNPDKYLEQRHLGHTLASAHPIKQVWNYQYPDDSSIHTPSKTSKTHETVYQRGAPAAAVLLAATRKIYEQTTLVMNKLLHVPSVDRVFIF